MAFDDRLKKLVQPENKKSFFLFAQLFFKAIDFILNSLSNRNLNPDAISWHKL